jgi:hypothetical protein
MTTLTALSEVWCRDDPSAEVTDFGVLKLGQVIDEANRTIHFTDPIVLADGDAPVRVFVHSPVEVATLHEFVRLRSLVMQSTRSTSVFLCAGSSSTRALHVRA